MMCLKIKINVFKRFFSYKFQQQKETRDSNSVNREVRVFIYSGVVCSNSGQEENGKERENWMKN